MVRFFFVERPSAGCEDATSAVAEAVPGGMLDGRAEADEDGARNRGVASVFGAEP